MEPTQKYSDVLVDWLVELGYSTCFFVAGGNSMHLLDGFRKRMKCVPVVHEVTAGIAAEYFNVHSRDGKALVLLTAGPGLTNCVTAIAGAWLESHELLVIGGQVKSSDLMSPGMRQRGIQEIDGVSLVASITKIARRITTPAPFDEVADVVRATYEGRKGPCFLEVCLDVQGAPVKSGELRTTPAVSTDHAPRATSTQIDRVIDKLRTAQRPVLLLGGGLDRESTWNLREELDSLGIPILTTWNGADRYSSDGPLWFGRPDTWGMRSSNLILQQSDLVVALGVRLSLQQTGFNWEQFVPVGEVIQVEIDESETCKGHPARTLPIIADANDFLKKIVSMQSPDVSQWVEYCRSIRNLISLNDAENSFHPGFFSPFDFVLRLSELCTDNDAIVPCSSGGANTVMMQAFLNKRRQVFFNNKALASMGYGLGGAIGASLANITGRTVLVEGDGGFVQNLQDLATVSVNNLNLKTFIFSNEGYASIRMTQRNYFAGEYLGCDTKTGLGFPAWELLAKAYDIEFQLLPEAFETDSTFQRLWETHCPAVFLVPIHPDQTYLPKISSRVTSTGGMESSPLHQMSPDLPDSIRQMVTKYLPNT